ncbi:MAG: alpha/beta hydrolase, partial [Sphingomonas sp.]
MGDRLREAGYSSLAIDQRAGGDLFGPQPDGRGARGTLGAMPAQSAISRRHCTGRGNKHLPVILWGSSYSAALVFLVAAEHPGQVRGDARLLAGGISRRQAVGPSRGPPRWPSRSS